MSITLLILIFICQVGVETKIWEWSPNKNYQESIVRVSVDPINNDASTYRTACGVHIGNKQVVTCAHIIDGRNKIYVSTHTQKKIYMKRIIGEDRTNDLVILECKDDINAPAALIAQRSCQFGDRLDIVALGGLSSLKNKRHFIAKAEIPTNQQIIFSNVCAIPGDSGGGVFNENGELCGIIKGGWFWFDGGVKSAIGENINVTWPARITNVTPIRNLLRQRRCVNCNNN